jgi:hypothetical protein
MKNVCIYLLTIRVNRLGEFSPFGWLFSLGFVLKIREVAHIFWPIFSTVKFRYYFRQIWVGLRFGRFFHKLIWSPCWTPGTKNFHLSKSTMFRVLEKMRVLDRHLHLKVFFPRCPQSGWPDWANFRVFGDPLVWAVFYYRSTPNFSTTFLHCIVFNKKWVGRRLGRIFHKLIRSPCPQSTFLPGYLFLMRCIAIVSRCN